MARIVQAGAVKYILELMNPAVAAAGVIDKAVAMLSNLFTIREGRTAIGREGGVRPLVKVVELGSARGKETAASSLLQIYTNSERFCNMVLQEGVTTISSIITVGHPKGKSKVDHEGEIRLMVSVVKLGLLREGECSCFLLQLCMNGERYGTPRWCTPTISGIVAVRHPMAKLEA